MGNVNIMITTAATTTATTAAPNNNNNNNNNNGGSGSGSGSGSGNNNNNNNSGRRSLFGQSSWFGSGIGLGLAHRHKRGVLTSSGWQGLAEVRNRLEILMREYLSKITTSQDKKDEMLLSGDWTDSALREATTSGPFSGVAGWRELQGGPGLSRGTISASQLMEAFHDIQRLRIEAGPGYALPILM